jgi:hypothetical protein
MYHEYPNYLTIACLALLYPNRESYYPKMGHNVSETPSLSLAAHLPELTA